MADTLARINLLTDIKATLETATEDGTPGIATDYAHRLGWLSGGAWRWGAVSGAAESFASVKLANIPAGKVPTATVDGQLVQGSISDDGTTATLAGNVAIDALASGKIPYKNASTGNLADSSLSEDATSVMSAKAFSGAAGLGVFGVTPPTSRPTISGQRTATATLAALYQALGLTGLILDSTTGTSVTREASVTLLALTANAPSDVTIAGGVRAYGFPGTGTMKELFFAVDFQHDYIAGGDITAHGHWLPATGAGGDVKWQAESMWVEAGGVWDTTALNSSTVAAGAVAKADKRFDITLSGTGHTYNSRLVVRVFRDSADAADTYTGDAILPVFGVHYQADPGQP